MVSIILLIVTQIVLYTFLICFIMILVIIIIIILFFRLINDSEQVGEEMNIQNEEEVHMIGDGSVVEVTIETDGMNSNMCQKSEYDKKFCECSTCGHLCFSELNLKLHIKGHYK